MILEFAGLPGVGKSSLETKLLAQLVARALPLLGRKELESLFCRSKFSDRDFRYVYYFELWARFLLYSFSRLEILSPFISRWCAPGYWFLKDKDLSSFYLTNALGNGCKIPAFYCPSEGLIQHTANLRVWEGEDVLLARDWSEGIDCSGIALVFCELKMEVAFERFWQRGVPDSWPSSCTKKGAAFKVFRRFKSALQLTLKEFEQGGGQVFRVDLNPGQEELEELIPSLADEIAAKIRGN